jgi:putative colanic acid biosynthesis UDP-glucose lipid carrier transferase
MEQNFYTQLQFLRKTGDYILLNVAFFLGYFLKFGLSFEVFASNNYLSFLLFFNLSWIISTSLLRSYASSQTRLTFLNTTEQVVRLIILHLLMIAAFNGIIKTYFSRLFILYTYTSFTFLILIWRFLSIWFLVQQKRKKNLQNRYLVFGLELDANVLLDDHNFFKKNRLIHIEHVRINWMDYTGDSGRKKLRELLDSYTFSEIFISANRWDEEGIVEILDYTDKNLKRLHFVVDSPALTSKQLELIRYNQIPVINIKKSPLDTYGNKIIKRTFDLIFAVFILVFVLSWLFPLLYFAIRLNSKGPALFKQLRTGLNNESFVCYKFRTMEVNSEADKIQATQNDPRITKLGNFLRRTSIDELPQFLNVLRGEMSVVGPRPHMLKHTEEYAREIGSFMQRHAVKPGITGLAQAKGYRGEIRSHSHLKNRVRLDRFYVENWSLNLDIKIIFLTIRHILKPTQ